MTTSKKALTSEQAQALIQLKRFVKKGTRLEFILRHRSASGMSHTLDVFTIAPASKKDGGPYMARLSYNIATLCGLVYDRKHEGIRLGGCGYSKDHHITAALEDAMGMQPNTLKYSTL